MFTSFCGPPWGAFGNVTGFVYVILVHFPIFVADIVDMASGVLEKSKMVIVYYYLFLHSLGWGVLFCFVSKFVQGYTKQYKFCS